MTKKNKSIRVAEQPLYSYWEAIFKSFYSRSLYIDVGKRWRGYGILYLLLVISLATIPLAARVIYEFRVYFNEQLLSPLSKLPPLYVQNGSVIFDKPMPYLIKNNANEVVAIIDTTGQVNKIEATYPKLAILITKDKFYFRPPRFHLFFQDESQLPAEQPFVQSLDKSSNEVFNAKSWIESSGVLSLKRTTELLVYPAMALFLFALYLGFSLMLAFIGQLFSIIIFKFKLQYKEAARLYMVGSTPQIIIFYIFLISDLSFPGLGLLYLVLLAIYFNYGVMCFKQASNKMVRG